MGHLRKVFQSNVCQISTPIKKELIEYDTGGKNNSCLLSIQGPFVIGLFKDKLSLVQGFPIFWLLLTFLHVCA